MSAAPRISVIVPCYNVERWLPRCLDETLAALPPDAELIAVDDGSTDATLAVLQARASIELRLRVIAAVHAGVSAARNRALDVCCGAYVFFVDPDDGVEPDFFTAMVGTLEREGADCCVCGYSMGEDGEEDRREIALKGDYRYSSNADIVRDYLPRIFGYSMDDVRAWYAGKSLFSHREMAYSWRMAFRRDVIERAKVRFDVTLELNEDAMFNAEFLLAADSMTCVNRPLYNMHCRDSGAVRTLHRDGVRYCRNKLAMLAKRDSLDAHAGGRLAPLYAASCVFSAMEILLRILRRRVLFGEGWSALKAYLDAESVRKALPEFPLSWRRPDVALAVTFLRLLVHCRRP